MDLWRFGCDLMRMQAGIWNGPDNETADRTREIDARLDRGEPLFDEQAEDMESAEVLKALSLDPEAEARALSEQAEDRAFEEYCRLHLSTDFYSLEGGSTCSPKT